MEYSFEEPDLSDFVSSELRRVTTDNNFMGNHDQLITMFKQLSSEELEGDHWSQAALYQESVEDPKDECVAHTEYQFCENNSEHLSFLEPTPVQEDNDDTKILIQIDNNMEEDVKESQCVDEETPNGYISAQVSQMEEDNNSECGESSKPCKIQIINSHNLKRNDVILKSILRSMRRYL